MIGAGLRLCALLLLLVGGLKAYETYTADASIWAATVKCSDYALFALLFALFGSFFAITSKEVAEMKDSEKLYAYTSGIMGVLALIVAVIGIFK